MCSVARTEAIVYVVIKWNYKWWKPKSACNNFMNEITQRKKMREGKALLIFPESNPCFCFLEILSQLSRLFEQFYKRWLTSTFYSQHVSPTRTCTWFITVFPSPKISCTWNSALLSCQRNILYTVFETESN